MAVVDYTEQVKKCVLSLIEEGETPPGTVAFIRDHASQEMIDDLVWHGYLPSV